MPQLDQFTYLTQFVWLCVFYMTFYVLLFNDGLPKISRILKLRAHLCADRPRYPRKDPVKNRTFTRDSSRLTFRVTGAQARPLRGIDRAAEARSRGPGFTRDVVFRTLDGSISYLNSCVTGAFSWCTRSVETLNANQLKAMNKSYLRSIGEISLSQLIKYSALEASAPLTCAKAPLINSRPLFLEISRVWALRVQKTCFATINKKKKKK